LGAILGRATGIVVDGRVREVGDGDVGAEPGERCCRGSADSVIGAGDDGHAAVERKAGHGKLNLSTNGWASTFVNGLPPRRRYQCSFGSGT
jgi:hypothetical protein